MAFEHQDNVREYYRRITEVDIGAVARELLGAHVLHESDRLLQCDCPNHSSQSHRSLHVMLDKQGWYCFGCGVGGDVLQLVEFIQSGRVTRGRSGPMPESHQHARDFLAAKVGLPSLAKHGLSPEELAEAEAERLVELRVHDVLTALAEHYHGRLKDNPEVLEWVRSKYGLTVETVDRLLIGYADNDGDENSARDMTAFCNSIESIATDTGAAVAFAHHFSKGQQGAKAAIDRASGSGVFGRDPDAVATLSELEGDDCAGFLLEWTLREFAAPPPVALLFQWPVHRVEKLLNDRKVKGAPGRPQAVTTLDIVNALDVVEGEPTIPAVAVHLGVSEKTVRNCVNRAESLLIDGGVIRFQKGQ